MLRSGTFTFEIKNKYVGRVFDLQLPAVSIYIKSKCTYIERPEMPKMSNLIVLTMT